MKNGILLTWVLVFFAIAMGRSMAQSSAEVITVATPKPDGMKVDCRKCGTCEQGKNCEKCKSCKSSVVSKEEVVPSSEDFTEVKWSNKSLKPATSLQKLLDVRSGPGAAFKVVGTVTSEDPLIVIGEREGWYKIVLSSADLVGFVEATNVQIGK